MPIAYWASERMRQCFQDGTPLGEIAPAKVGQNTGDNARFLRRWHEVTFSRIAFGITDGAHAIASMQKWFPYNKGGEFRRWYGNCEYILNWEDDGREVKEYAVIRNDGKHWSRYIQNLNFMFRPALTWSFISSSFFAVRCSDAGFLFDVIGSSVFPPDDWRKCIAGFLCSSVAFDMLKVLNQTMAFQVGNVAALPVLQPQLLARKSAIDKVVREAVQLTRTDWDSFETSWDFQTLPVLRDQGTDAPRAEGRTLSQSQAVADAEALTRFQCMRQLETENNRLFIDTYGLQEELSPEVPEDQITLYRPNREEDIKRLISYAIGCIMGRYSLDKPGLIYAHSANKDFDPGQYYTFPADDDGIIPLMETDWFPDDASNRLIEFISVAWPKEHLADDIAAASSTSHRKKLEKERDTLRKQHTELQTFDEQLRHYADRRISLDLDDGVKVNYGKFGELLAEVKAITGGSLDES